MTVATAAVATTERKRPPWRPSRGQAVLTLTALSALGTLLAARVSAVHLPPVSGGATTAQPVQAAAPGSKTSAAQLAAAEGTRAAQIAAIGRLSASLHAAALSSGSTAPSSAAAAQKIQLPPLPALPPVTVSRASGG